MYEVIYAPDGEAFEVISHKVPDLVLNNGWTRQPVKIVKIQKTPRRVIDLTVEKEASKQDRDKDHAQK